MSPEMFEEFEKILSKRSVGGAVLEIGAVPTSDSLLNIGVFSGVPKRVGINLDGGSSYTIGDGERANDYEIIKGNANNMTCFENDSFDMIICNSVFEHDKFFWKSISEIRRVAKDGALIVIGVPGYDKLEDLKPVMPRRVRGSFKRRVKYKARQYATKALKRVFPELSAETPTLCIHNWPGDYYRFSPQAFKEVFFEGMRDVEIYSVMVPPRVIGIGYNVK